MSNKHWLVTYSRAINEELLRNEEEIYFISDKEGNSFLNDLEHFPHAFVLACCMDRQVDAERAWSIPIAIKRICPEFTIEALAAYPLEWYREVFQEHSLHRYNEKMSEAFFLAVQRIKKQYGGDASRIWAGKPSTGHQSMPA